MTQQATAILLDWGHEHTIEEQEKFSVYFGKLMDEHYYPKQVLVTGRTMEAIIENYESEQK